MFSVTSACGLAIGASAALAVSAAPAQAARTIKRGDHGDAVRALQRALGQHADGAFGPATKRAVIRFQRRHGLTADGVVGPTTWKAILAARARNRTLRAAPRPSSSPRVESRGSAVRTLQRRLGLSADGVFGPQTKAAVRRFQQRHGLTADGVVGPATWSALGVGGTPPVLKAGRLRGGASPSGGGAGTAIRRMVAAANRIDGLPYKYGGGHRSFSDTGYDCSGSVSYVLHAAGLLRTPMDSSQLMSYGAPGRGRHVTIYANPGHAYMVIDGRRFDTSGDAAGRWQTDLRSSAGYTARHPPGY